MARRPCKSQPETLGRDQVLVVRPCVGQMLLQHISSQQTIVFNRVEKGNSAQHVFPGFRASACLEISSPAIPVAYKTIHLRDDPKGRHGRTPCGTKRRHLPTKFHSCSILCGAAGTANPRCLRMRHLALRTLSLHRTLHGKSKFLRF